MKKRVSLVLIFALAIALISTVMIPNVYAEEIEGMWRTMGDPMQDSMSYYDDKKSVPGYTYTSDGFSTIAADWSTSVPYVTVQSKQKVDLKAGIYMEIRIDEFSYDAAEGWFNIHIWDGVNIAAAQSVDNCGEGIQTIMIPSEKGPTDEIAPEGSCSSVLWYKEAFSFAGTSAIDSAPAVRVGDTVKDILLLDIGWNGTSYTLEINNSPAPAEIIEYMNGKFADGEAYIGFTMSNSKRNGKAAATVTKFGTSRTEAATPMGSDSKVSQNFNNATSPIADPSTVASGLPAIFMTGDRSTDLMNIPYSSTGSSLEITQSGSVKIKANSQNVDFGVWKVDKDKSYDIADFPVVMCMTKNWCACKMDTHYDCLALECIDANVLWGDETVPTSRNRVNVLDMCYDPTIIDGDNYLYFYKDMSEFGAEGRFNGVMFTCTGCDLETSGFDEFEMLWVGLFRNTKEATAFAQKYLEFIESGLLPGNPEDQTTDDHMGTTDTEATEVERTMSTGNIYADSYTSVSINEKYYGKIFKFIPEKSGAYIFTSVGRYNTIGYVMNSRNSTLGNDMGGDGNFSVEVWMIAGNTYYLCTEMYDVNEYGMYNVYVSLVQSEETITTDPSIISTTDRFVTTDGEDHTDHESFTGWNTDDLSSFLESNSDIEGESGSESKAKEYEGSLLALDGCFISVGVGGIAMILTSVLGAMVCVKRKNDDK